MEGSSESAWQRSGSSRGLGSSSVLDRNNPRFGRGGIAVRSSGEGSGKVFNQESSSKAFAEGSEKELALRSGSLYQTVGECNDISLRHWLDNTERTVDALECMHIFTQIVEIVNLAHSQGIAVHNVRPSCFVMSSFNRVSFIESASCSDSGSDSGEDGTNSRMAEFKGLGSGAPPEGESQLAEPGQPAVEGAKNNDLNEEKNPSFPMKQILQMESNWYSTPEEVNGGTSTCASDIFRLGILLFELFCTFSSAEAKKTTMSSLRHRVLPPQLLLKWPKEASFCLWLLHPDPSSRPSVGELLQSEFLNEPRDSIEEREAAVQLREKIDEQELLLEFLLLLKQKKQEAANHLQEIVSFLSSDINEVNKLRASLRKKGSSTIDQMKDSASAPPAANTRGESDSDSSRSRKRCRPGVYMRDSEGFDDLNEENHMSEGPSENHGDVLSKSNRLMQNFRKLELAYFLTRRRALKPLGKPFPGSSVVSSEARGSIGGTEKSSLSHLSSKEQYNDDRQGVWINSFLDGLCKYLSYTKLKVKADLKQGDLLNSSNLVCSLSFDRDGEFFATAGVNKKIKVFEYNSILNENRDIHYPVVEMASKSKLSSICWNGYIKSQLASSNFDGVVQVWDVARNQIFMEMREHERRVWSVDYSVADPTLLASGSDDGSVKLWNINQGVSVGTIKTKANVCCVQFPSESGRCLAFGSADHRVYYYDLRNLKMPVCTLVGHNKTVSYVKFIDSTTLVSASTDNTLKLWDLSTCSARVIDSPIQSFTGHLNVKNFVGLAVSDGYIATGSETNEVVVYHKAFPMPAVSYKFNTTDSLGGDEGDEGAQFISSVCWRGKSSTLVAANSTGNIKLLELV